MQKSIKQMQTVVRLLCSSSHGFIEGFHLSRKELQYPRKIS